MHHRRRPIIHHHDAESIVFGNVNRQQQLWRHRRSSRPSSIKDNNNNNDDDDDDDENGGFDDNNNLKNDDNTRQDTLGSILESSWNQPSMGTVPTTPINAAIAATDCMSNAMSTKNYNVMMIDLRLPSYVILEGQRFYDTMAVYNFGVELATRMQNRGLVRKSLILVRNGMVCEEIERVINRQQQLGAERLVTSSKKIYDDDHENDNDYDDEEDNLLRKWTKEQEPTEKLMSSWESSSLSTNSENENSSIDLTSSSVRKVIIDDTNSSHRLWSMVGNDIKNNIGRSSLDAFNYIIAAVDINARLQTDEDALIILSPYDTTDIVALRRILSQYGSTHTIVIVKSRFDTDPSELDNAVLVYGMLPLVATTSRSSRKNDDYSVVERRESTTTPGLRAVIMKRYPKDWTVYVDINGDGFVKAKNDGRGDVGWGMTTKRFPPPEWIAQRVQAHVEGLLQQPTTRHAINCHTQV